LGPIVVLVHPLSIWPQTAEIDLLAAGRPRDLRRGGYPQSCDRAFDHVGRHLAGVRAVIVTAMLLRSLAAGEMRVIIMATIPLE